MGGLNKKRLQSGESALVGRGEKRSQKTLLLGRIRGGVATVGNMPPSAAHELATVHLFESKNLCNLTIGVVERFAKNICGPFRRREPLQKDEDCTL